MENMLCWLWLTSKKGISSDKITKLFKYFDTVEDIYSAKSYNNIYGISASDVSMLMDKDLSKANEIADRIFSLGGKILLYDDENYPEMLKNIQSPPYVLYIQGKFPNVDELLTVGVVGTRKSTDYGNAVTERICRSLAENGVVTVGGLASGIDAVGAWATIDAGGIAIGVLGCGLDRAYPSKNAELYKAMLDRGCIVTEYPPGTPPLFYHFPIRNRIIAGLSRGVLVTEAPKGSGALITARHAIDNNRDVFAVPRNITEENYIGTNILIQQGARLVNGAEDILKEYPYAVKVPAVKKSDKKTFNAQPDDKKYDNLNEKEKLIVGLLKKQDMQIDEISRELNISIGELNTKLMLLEVNGYIKKMPGSRYQLKI